jgi:hypothetical protein
LSVPQSNEISSVAIVKECMEAAAITVIGEPITTAKVDWA